MAFSPENGSVPSNPTISYSVGNSSSARSQATQSSGGSGGTTNRAASVRKRQTKIKTTKPRDQTSGQALISQDVSFGLNRPYLLWNGYAFNLEVNPAATPSFSTTSGTFVSLITFANEPQHARLRVRARVVMGATTTGEVRLVDRNTGTVINGPLVIGSGATVEQNLDATLIAPTLAGVGAPMKVDLQARVTSGANTIAVLVVYAIGIGT